MELSLGSDFAVFWKSLKNILIKIYGFLQISFGFLQIERFFEKLSGGLLGR